MDTDGDHEVNIIHLALYFFGCHCLLFGIQFGMVLKLSESILLFVEIR